MNRPLFDAYPQLADTLPITELATLPTPLLDAGTLADDHKLALWLKQDAATGETYGGNKVRKLEFLLADALEQRCTDVITYGAAGSNHALATSIYARQYGLRCHAILSHQPASPKVAKTLRYHLNIGTQMIPADGFPAMQAAAKAAQQRIQAEGGSGYEIPFGGSSATGTVGFVNAAFELKAQIDDGLLPAPDLIYVACGTSGSATGLSLGLRLAGLQTKVVAVQVTPDFLSNADAHAKLFEETNRLLHTLDPAIPLLDDPLQNIIHRHDQFGSGYAEATEQGDAAVAKIKNVLGLQLETTYTGKALAALMDDVAKGAIDGQNVVFWNTYNAQPYPDPRSDDNDIPEELQRYLSE